MNTVREKRREGKRGWVIYSAVAGQGRLDKPGFRVARLPSHPLSQQREALILNHLHIQLVVLFPIPKICL